MDYNNYMRFLNENKRVYTRSYINLLKRMRELWEQHVVWTRLFIISTLENLADVELVTQRLLRNPADFERALVPFYGKEKAAQFRELLSQHLLIAAQLVNSAKMGDTNAVQEFNRQWYQNARDIAQFMASINPHWSQQDLENMLFEHLDLTQREAVENLNRNYAASIELFDMIERQALEMADAFTDGIARQFPNSFI